MKSQKIGVIAIRNSQGELVAIIYKDGSNAPIIFNTTVASDEEIADLVDGKLGEVVFVN